jgi:hypothetical protein
MDKKLVKEVLAEDKYDAEEQITSLLKIDEVRLIEGTEQKETIDDEKFQGLKDIFGFR